jgi:hypothetical protein
MYWDDRGAGTFGLLNVYTNYYVPRIEGRGFAPCEFGDIAIPLACECGC